MSTVVCVDCRAVVPQAQVELSPNGWRCQKCSLQHQIDIHHGADNQVGEISVEEMRGRADRAATYAWLAIGGAIVFALLIYAGAFSNTRRMTGKVLAVPPVCLAFAGYELVAYQRARRAVQIMEQRSAGNEPVIRL